MYLVANDTKLIIELLQVGTNKLIAIYFYDSALDYSLGLNMLLFLFVDSWSEIITSAKNKINTQI